MAKATAVKAVIKINEVEGQSCAACHKPLKAPWGRVKGKWVCSSSCDKLYRYHLSGIDSNIETIRRLTSMA